MWASTYLLIYVIPVINLYHLCLADPVLMCYYPSTARLRNTTAKFEIKDINFTLCTHYIYNYAVIDNVTHKLVASDPQAEEGPSGLYRQFTNAKIQSPSIKTLLAVGGTILYAYEQCLAVGENTTILSEFVTSAATFLRLYGFDGLDVYCPSVSALGKTALSNILKALREKFDETISNDRLILAASAPGIDMNVRRGNDVASMARTVDYVIIATHQLYCYPMPFTHFPTPLYPLNSSHPYNMLGLNVSLSVWNSLGMPFNKTVVGFTGVGRLLELVNQSNYQPWAPVTSSTLRGPYYNISYGLAYPEICAFRQKANQSYDDIQKSPYMVDNRSWVGYDNPESLQLKIEWLKQFHVGGIMFSGLDEDDFTGTTCGGGQYPLVTAILDEYLKTSPGDPEIDHSNTTTATTNTTTISPKDDRTDQKENTNITKYVLFVLLLMLLPILITVILFFLWRRKKSQRAE